MRGYRNLKYQVQWSPLLLRLCIVKKTELQKHPAEKEPLPQKAAPHAGNSVYPLKPGSGLPAHQQNRKRHHLHERPQIRQGGGGDPHQLPAPERQGTAEHHLFLCFLFKDKPRKTPVQGADTPGGYRAAHGYRAPGDGPGDQ